MRLMPMLLLLFLAPSAVASDSKGTIKITLKLENNDGMVRCALFSTAAGFPSENKKAHWTLSVKPKKKSALCEFKDVALGDYAMAAFHDEDGDGELDTNLFGIPSEGIGATNNAKGSFGPPKFADAKFSVASSEFNQTITLDY